MINIDVFLPTLQPWQIIAFASVILFEAIIFWSMFKNKSGYDGYYLISENEWGDNFRLHPIVGTTSVFICLLYIMVYILIYPELSIFSFNNVPLSELYPTVGVVIFLLSGVANLIFGSLGLGL